MAAGIRSAWVVPLRPSETARIRLFCFPYAGVGASAYRSWPRDLPSTVDVMAVQPPGREARWAEQPFRSVDTLVPATAEALLAHLTPPFVFFGHSLGALVCFEVARYLRRHTKLQPSHMFVSGHRAPQVPNRYPAIRALPDRDFVGRIRDTYDGIPQAVLDSEALLDLLLPCLRADFTAYETYQFREEPPLACSMTAFGGIGDMRVTERDVSAWRVQTQGRFRFQMFDGGHFFVHSRQDEVLSSIVQELNLCG
jgi:medium-chain acyl-[acyl-carrier-protein] hydrolase